MFSRLFVTTLILLAFVIWIAVLWAQGTINPTTDLNGLGKLFAPFGIVVSLITFALLIFNLWAWRFVPFQHRPYLGGTWKGVLNSNFERDGTIIPPLEAYAVVRQTYFSISLRQYTAKSESKLLGAEVVTELDGAQFITGTYINTPSLEERELSPIHHGGLLLRFHPSPRGAQLKGQYWTDRVFQSSKGVLCSQGTLLFTARVNRKCSGFTDARFAFEQSSGIIERVLRRFGFVKVSSSDSPDGGPKPHKHGQVDDMPSVVNQDCPHSEVEAAEGREQF